MRMTLAAAVPLVLAIALAPGPVHQGDADLAAARRVAAQWISLAKAERWSAMVKLAQPSWVARQKAPAEAIANNYDFFIVKSSRITKATRQGSAMITVEAEIETQLGTHDMRANIIREGGQWTVNPISAMFHRRP